MYLQVQILQTVCAQKLYYLNKWKPISNSTVSGFASHCTVLTPTVWEVNGMMCVKWAILQPPSGDCLAFELQTRLLRQYSALAPHSDDYPSIQPPEMAS